MGMTHRSGDRLRRGPGAAARRGLALIAMPVLLLALGGPVADAQSGYGFVAKWGSPGTGDGQFNLPLGVALDPAGNLYVADYGNHRIQKFSSSGAFIAKWGSRGATNSPYGQFLSVNDVATDAAGNVYVTDTTERIQKFSPDGAFLGKWGSAGSGNGQSASPGGLATDAAHSPRSRSSPRSPPWRVAAETTRMVATRLSRRWS